MQGMFVWLEWQDQHLWGTTNCTELRLTVLTTTEDHHHIFHIPFIMRLIIARTTCVHMNVWWFHVDSWHCICFLTSHTQWEKTNCHRYYLQASTGLAVYARLSIMVVSSAYNSIASFTFEGNVRPCSFINVSTISKNSKVAGGSGISV